MPPVCWRCVRASGRRSRAALSRIFGRCDGTARHERAVDGDFTPPRMSWTKPRSAQIRRLSLGDFMQPRMSRTAREGYRAHLEGGWQVVSRAFGGRTLSIRRANAREFRACFPVELLRGARSAAQSYRQRFHAAHEPESCARESAPHCERALQGVFSIRGMFPSRRKRACFRVASNRPTL